ncbi:YagK/YfjJ domain-containing protein [Pseudomonas aeruginosa]|uniref:YagK/YfjJ domain-containing protein n=1 Tax=Pseudomonas aeruginosa TaxID=287 RepID=UPI0036FF468D
MKTTYEPTYKNQRINTNQAMGFGCYVGILDGIHRQLTNLQSYDSRIQVIRFEIRLPSKKTYDVKEENRQLRAFFKSVKENLALKHWGAHNRVIHGWTREVGKTNHGHYHVFIAFKRLTVRFGTFSRERYTGIWEMLRRCAKRITGASLRFCPVVHILERGDASAFDECFYHLSYLAKLKDKEFGAGSGHKVYDFSRLPHKGMTKSLRNESPA